MPGRGSSYPGIVTRLRGYIFALWEKPRKRLTPRLKTVQEKSLCGPGWLLFPVISSNRRIWIGVRLRGHIKIIKPGSRFC